MIRPIERDDYFYRYREVRDRSGEKGIIEISPKHPIERAMSEEGLRKFTNICNEMINSRRR